MTQPDSIPAEWIEACARARVRASYEALGRLSPEEVELGVTDMMKTSAGERERLTARIMIAAVRPLIEAETRERCAQIAERFRAEKDHQMSFTARSIASALRAEGK